MSSFRTELPLPHFPLTIAHRDTILCMGSCFAEHIGQRLVDLKFSTVLNPFGILYNPASIQTALQILLDQKTISRTDLFQYRGIWHSPFHHSRFSGVDKTEVWTKISTALSRAKVQLAKSNRLMLTLGTAYVYEDKKSQTIVANCHKLPAQQFQKRRLTVDEIVAMFAPLFQTLQAKNAALDIILTLSPVRHIRDGMIENQQSKATLILAIAALVEKMKRVHYFPAYELVLDDLRDYRFFAADMVHPNTTAIDYVWTRFGKAFFQASTTQLIAQIEKIIRASQHRPFFPESAAHQLFIQKQVEKITQLQQKYPFLDFSKEKTALTAT